jgi:trimeric autotransporter adhesin
MQVFRGLAAVALAMAMAGTAAAQSATGGLRGAVKDANGVVPGVTVELINEGTAIARDVVTNDQGEYNFPAVQPGTYTVKAALTGFKTYENKGVRIGAQQFVTLDITLDVGQLQETITVTGQAPLIDTSNASTGSVIDSQQLQTLPSAGRSAFLFAVTVPTVVASGDSQFNRQQDQTNASLLSLGGGTRRGNNYLIDGVPTTDMRNRASSMPTIEALEEVNVQLHTYDAETGRTGGGTFNIATKSGTNSWRGSGFYQNRPAWGSKNNFFSDLAGQPKPETYFHLGGAGFGGPIAQNRTFFWAAFEGYGSNTTRNGGLRFPTSRELNGDFSQSTNAAGVVIPIYDPLTGDPVTGLGRQQFPGNIIPQNRINPVSRAMASHLPRPDVDVSNGSNNFNRTAEINDRAYMYTGKVDHRFSDAVSLNGFYLYNKSDEPCANYWEPGLNGAQRYADPGDYILRRRVHTLALNNTWIPSNSTVVTLRYGWNRFLDNNTLSTDFDAATLGFPSSFLSAIQVNKFPQIIVTDYNSSDAARMMGAIDPVDINWHSWGANGAVTKLMGRHTVKFGMDYRMIGLDFQSFDNGAGEFAFDRRFTSLDPNSNGGNQGNAFASFLLGYPSGDPGNLSRTGTSTPLELFTHYYGFYAQDDFRVGSKLTLNYGLRLEHEDGLRERNDLITVAFDRSLNPGGALGNVVNPLTGQRVVGGLVYAGQNGANDYQGDPPGLKVSPRLGLVYSINPKTVIRAGYGTYWSPWNYQAPNNTNYGQIGAANVTEVQQGRFFPTTLISNPYPSGLLQPTGNALGALTGVGGEINFIDQDKKAPQVHMYSVDLNRELPGNIAVGFEYAGATGRDLGLGGSNDGIININQVPLQHLSLGSALNDQVANPFFGLPAGQGFNVGSATVARSQLLRPFPQFGNILMRQSTLGENQYHAAIFKFEKRLSNGWGGRVNYTWSRLKDNQFGEGNFFSRNSTEAADAYNIDAEYGIGILDVPHKIVFTPIFELPFGEGKRWATGGVGAAILGNWVISSIISLESGFPISLSANSNDLSGLGVRMQRVNLGSGELESDGTRFERIAPPSGASCVTGECGIGVWLRDGVAIDPVGLVLGTAPRNLDNVRTPHRNNVDFSASKDVKLGGSVRAQIKLEVINLTNTPKVRGPITTVGSSTFGQIRVQSGFQRLTQLMFKLSF